jgi:hypothetical protein
MKLQPLSRRYARRAALVALFALAWPAVARSSTLLECEYPLQPASKHGREPEAPSYCARELADGSLAIEPGYLGALEFGDMGMAEVFVQRIGWVYVKPNGETLSVMSFDNAADSFSEGLVRGQRDGKVVYFGADFAPAFPESFDWGWPFESGRALVCLGCVLEDDSGDEHRAIMGGRWGYIDRAGKPVVPIIYSREEIDRISQDQRRDP